MLVKNIFGFINFIYSKIKDIFDNDFIKGIFALIVIFVAFNLIYKPEKESLPDELEVPLYELDELIELSEDRTRDYSDILDDIENKAKEIKENAIQNYKDKREEEQEQMNEFYQNLRFGG